MRKTDKRAPDRPRITRPHPQSMQVYSPGAAPAVDQAGERPQKEAEYAMEAQSLLSKIWLPHPRDAVFSFLSDPRNLETTTPSWLRFSVLAPQPIEMRAGLLIDYRLRLHGFPFRWRSEITVWDPPNRFAEEQRRGPYRRWAHLHTFEENNGGTLCYDTVDYAALGGRLIEWLFVRHHVERIFQFRRERLAVLFA